MADDPEPKGTGGSGGCAWWGGLAGWVSPPCLDSEGAEAGPVHVTAGAPGSPGPGLTAGRAARAIQEARHLMAG